MIIAVIKSLLVAVRYVVAAWLSFGALYEAGQFTAAAILFVFLVGESKSRTRR